jgi:FkbM family methyltransferase
VTSVTGNFRYATSRARIVLNNIVGRALISRYMGNLIARIFRDQIPFRGLVVNTEAPSISPETKCRLLFRMYESAEVRFVIRYLRRDLDVIELGSSLGVVSCLIRRLIARSQKLVCVEPNPELVPILLRNLSRNAPSEYTTVKTCAVTGDAHERGHASFQLGASNSSRIALEGDCGSMSVPVSTLSGLQRETDIETYALVCDIEGAEAGLLFEDKDAFRQCRQIIIELHDTVWRGQTITVDSMCRLIGEQLGFVLRERYGPVFVFDK